MTISIEFVAMEWNGVVNMARKRQRCLNISCFHCQHDNCSLRNHDDEIVLHEQNSYSIEDWRDSCIKCDKYINLQGYSDDNIQDHIIKLKKVWVKNNLDSENYKYFQEVEEFMKSDKYKERSKHG